MANQSNMDKNIKDMTKQEIMRALADQGDKNVSSGNHLLAPPGDPLTWEFDGRTRELLDAFHATFKPEENLVADDVELFCICNGPDDGGPMIECSNGSICPLKWFHLDCIGMEIDEIPGEQEDWFCRCCVDTKLGKLRHNEPDFISELVATKTSADKIEDYHAIEHAATIMVAKDEEAKRNTGEESRGSHSEVTEKQKQNQNQKIPTSHGTIEVDSTFVADPDVAESYNLHSVASAKATFLYGETSAAADPPTNGSFKTPSTCDGYDGNFEISQALAEPGGKKGKVGWTAEEKAHLIQCIIASNNAGLSGESLWTDVYPKMLA